jgi:DNA (cytosine-5)-methyltransferase 1
VTYLDILTEAWRQHLAPRTEDAPTVISTFAGCGGSSLGYSMAGYRELLAVEWDDNAVATFRLNFPEVPVYHGDIAKLSVGECLEMTGLQPGELDVLDGSPPCQGFSTAGKRQLDDPRNNLFMEYIRLLRGLQPKVFVAENVSGMVKGKMKLVFAEVLRELKASGYKVSARLMNAMYFHVPQSRERLIFVGVREDLGMKPSHPKAEARPYTVREAFENVPADAEAFICGVHTKIYQDMLNVPSGGSQPGHHSHVRLPYDRPSMAVLADSGFGHYHYWHPTEQRTLTFMELRRIASFPKWFRLLGEPGEKWARIGNSVPPLFMRAIAGHVREQILAQMSLDRRLAD